MNASGRKRSDGCETSEWLSFNEESGKNGGRPRNRSDGGWQRKSDGGLCGLLRCSEQHNGVDEQTARSSATTISPASLTPGPISIRSLSMTSCSRCPLRLPVRRTLPRLRHSQSTHDTFFQLPPLTTRPPYLSPTFSRACRASYSPLTVVPAQSNRDHGPRVNPGRHGEICSSLTPYWLRSGTATTSAEGERASNPLSPVALQAA